MSQKIMVTGLRKGANENKVIELIGDSLGVSNETAGGIVGILPYDVRDFNRNDPLQLQSAASVARSLASAGALINVIGDPV